MRYYVIAGEASGDLHGSNLIGALQRLDGEADFRCWGGDLMQAKGAELVKHYRDLAFMGFVEVLANIRTIMRNMKFCKQDILDYKPDVLILIDYPGFNLRIAEFAHANGIKVFYYISPQVWAWKQSRVKKIRKVVDRMFVILPFEKEFYARFGYEVDFVGHPLLDAIAQYREAHPDKEAFYQKHGLEPDKPIIALLPGSRKQEIGLKLPIMLSVRNDFPEYQFVVAGAPSQGKAVYLAHGNDVKVVEGDTYGLLSVAKAALVTSGTATLETALFGVPEVVCYKGSQVSYLIARQLIKVKYISLVNLIMDRLVVKELIQKELNRTNLKEELQAILGGEKREAMKADFVALQEKLGGAGASATCARLMFERLS